MEEGVPSSYQKWGLAARTPINRQGWWKGEPASFQRPATSWDGELLSRGFLPATDSQKKSFYKGVWGGGVGRLHAETAHSFLAVVLKLVISCLVIIVWVVFSTVNLPLQALPLQI